MEKLHIMKLNIMKLHIMELHFACVRYTVTNVCSWMKNMKNHTRSVMKNHVTASQQVT